MTEATRCDAPGCGREGGHPGPHGLPVAPGITLAPWSERRREAFDDGEPIPCNSCREPLVLHPALARATCSSCDQMIAFNDQDGGYTQVVLPRLYPSNLTDPKMMRDYAEHEVGQWRFFDTLRLRFGLIGEVDFLANREKAAVAFQDFITNEVEPREAPRAPYRGTLGALVRFFHRLRELGAPRSKSDSDRSE